MRQFLPEGRVPSNERWTQAVRNSDNMKLVRSRLTELSGLSPSNEKPKPLNLDEAVKEFRVLLRDVDYLDLESDDFCSIDGEPLHRDLLNFIDLATQKRMMVIESSLLGKQVDNIKESRVPVFVTQEEAEKHTS